MSGDRYEKIWETVARIPAGRVMSYGEVAAVAGLPRHARFVSVALKKAPKSMKLPWHRVINGQGRISFPKGSGPYRTQKSRLRKEGVKFLKEKVAIEHRLGVTDDIDRLLWGPSSFDG